jgi:hypothetical protein
MDKKGQIDKLLATDALDIAEKITGESIHDDNSAATALGMGLHMLLNAEKRELLKETNDTYFSMLVGEFCAVLIMNGFTKVLDIPFVGTGYGNGKDIDENLYFFWNKDKSILVTFDTFAGRSVNGAKAYFNWREYEGQRHDMPINGGGRYNGFMGESIDAREGFIRYIERMEMGGEFLKKWESDPFLWLLHYMDTKDAGYDYKAINKERIKLLPAEVRVAINTEG